MLYLYDLDNEKKRRAKDILKSNQYISTQVLNEFSNISIKKLKLNHDDLSKNLKKIIEKTTVFVFNEDTILDAIDIREKYKFQYYDSLIIATALENKCTILYSEDMQHGQIIERQLKIINPFRELWIKGAGSGAGFDFGYNKKSSCLF